MREADQLYCLDHRPGHFATAGRDTAVRLYDDAGKAPFPKRG